MTDMERVRAALSHLSPHDRNEWVDMAFAIQADIGEEGFELWDSWGSEHPRPASEVKAVWKSARGGNKSGRSLALGTLFHRAKLAGWKDDASYPKPSAKQIEERKALAAARQAQMAAEEAAATAAAAEHAQRLWDAAADATEHPYLTRKGVLAHGLRVGKWERLDEETGEIIVTSSQALLIPMRDKKRRLHSLQAIYPDASSKKLYLKNGAKRGNFHAIGKTPQKDAEGRTVFVLVEGYATGASVHEATGHFALVCFDVSNLMPVAQAIRESQPGAVILIAADNDQQTEGNPGVTVARKVAAQVAGLVAVPVLAGEPTANVDFNDLAQLEGIESVEAFISAALVAPMADVEMIAAAPEPQPLDEPEHQPADTSVSALPMDPDDVDDTHASAHFSILGYDADHYFFFHHQKKQILARTSGNFSDIGLVELAPREWWEMHFQKSGGSGPGFDKIAAAQWIFAVAHARGVYDSSRVRGRGAWNDKGRVVFHHGDYLSVDGTPTAITHIDSAYVYPMGRMMPALTEAPSSNAQGEHLLNIAKMVRWTKPGSAALMAGWVFLSPICGALPWRPHIWITGPAGSGKSYIQNHYCATLVRGISEYFQGNSTEPGIRQKLRADALPVLIDELEPNDDRDRMRISSILTMIRQSSSESSAETVKGTVSGHGMHFHIRSMFCAASINTMLDKDSDSSRLTQLIIRAPAQSGADDDQWKELEEALHLIEKDGAWSQRLLARSLRMLPMILKNVEVFCKAAAKKFGTQRHGDQFGTLLAGAWCLHRSDLASEEQALDMIDEYEWSEHKEEGAPDDPMKALGTVMESKIRVNSTDFTVHELVSSVAGQAVGEHVPQAPAARDILNRNGMRVIGSEIVFGSTSSALRELVAKTAYATDLRGQLLRVPGANRHNNKAIKFSGVGSKVVAIPLDLLFDDEPPI